MSQSPPKQSSSSRRPGGRRTGAAICTGFRAYYRLREVAVSMVRAHVNGWVPRAQGPLPLAYVLPSPGCVQASCVVSWGREPQRSLKATTLSLPKHCRSHVTRPCGKPLTFAAARRSGCCTACAPAMASLQDQNTVARRLILELREGMVWILLHQLDTYRLPVAECRPLTRCLGAAGAHGGLRRRSACACT